MCDKGILWLIGLKSLGFIITIPVSSTRPAIREHHLERALDIPRKTDGVTAIHNVVIVQYCTRFENHRETAV
jgi:hypothetical protein